MTHIYYVQRSNQERIAACPDDILSDYRLSVIECTDSFEANNLPQNALVIDNIAYPTNEALNIISSNKKFYEEFYSLSMHDKLNVIYRKLVKK